MDFELLPIGTVVELKNSDIPVMISGYLSVNRENKDKVWDYSGFVFPVGYSKDDDILSFDHAQITNIIAYGYKDIQEMHFVAQVAEMRKTVLEKTKKEEE